jgi:hypothetical protein
LDAGGRNGGICGEYQRFSRARKVFPTNSGSAPNETALNRLICEVSRRAQDKERFLSYDSRRGASIGENFVAHEIEIAVDAANELGEG